MIRPLLVCWRGDWCVSLGSLLPRAFACRDAFWFGAAASITFRPVDPKSELSQDMPLAVGSGQGTQRNRDIERWNGRRLARFEGVLEETAIDNGAGRATGCDINLSETGNKEHNFHQGSKHALCTRMPLPHPRRHVPLKVSPGGRQVVPATRPASRMVAPTFSLLLRVV